MTVRQMRSVALATALAMAGTVVTGGPPAVAQNAGRSTMVAMSFCNRTSGKVFLALSYLESPSSSNWIVEGWKVIQAGGCYNISVPNNAYVYDYAEDESGGSWGADFKLCVEHPGPFRRINSGDYTCDESELVGFKEIDVTGLSSRTVNLNP